MTATLTKLAVLSFLSYWNIPHRLYQHIFIIVASSSLLLFLPATSKTSTIKISAIKGLFHKFFPGVELQYEIIKYWENKGQETLGYGSSCLG